MIRRYEPEDWNEVCRIHGTARVLELSNGGVDARAFKPMRAAADEDGFHDSETLVLSADHELVGFVSWSIDYTTWLYVDPRMHGRGIGKQLLAEALSRIGSEAWTSTIAENLPARSLYESAGMELVRIKSSLCEGYPCNVARLALPTSRMRVIDSTQRQV